MRVFLDTHALLWSFLDPDSLSRKARAIVVAPENTIFVSAVCAWEIAIKVRLGKLPHAVDLVQDFPERLRQLNLEEFHISADHVIRAGLLPPHHKDPFDRLLAAQCQAESIPIISNDEIFEHYGVRRIW